MERLHYKTKHGLCMALTPRNHGMIREAMEKSGVDREEFFLTSKVSFFPSSMDLPQDCKSEAKNCRSISNQEWQKYLQYLYVGWQRQCRLSAE